VIAKMGYYPQQHRISINYIDAQFSQPTGIAATSVGGGCLLLVLLIGSHARLSYGLVCFRASVVLSYSTPLETRPVDLLARFRRRIQGLGVLRAADERALPLVARCASEGSEVTVVRHRTRPGTAFSLNVPPRPQTMSACSLALSASNPGRHEHRT